MVKGVTRTDVTRRRDDDRKGSVIASAALLTARQLGLVRREGDRGWQAKAWEHYRTVPELMFGVDWRAAAVSRCPLLIAKTAPGDDTPNPVKHPLAEGILNDLFGDRRAAMLRRMVIHLDIVGETYLVGLDQMVTAPGQIDHDVAQPDGTRWLVVSALEFGGTDQVPTVRLPETGAEVELLPETSTVIRVWREDEQYAWRPTSATRHLADPLDEIQTISRSIKSAGRSRLTGPGLVAVAETVFGPPAKEPGQAPQFMLDLGEAMSAAIKDPDSPAAHVPICIPAQNDLIGKVFEHVKFGDMYDPKAVEQRDSAIRRVASGLDMPSELVTGLGESSNHWSAWQIEESAVKIHIEPMLELLCGAITAKFLRPALNGADEGLVVWYDTTPITARPNQGPEAIAAWEHELIGGTTTRHANGWGDADKPTEEERRQRLLLRLVETAPALQPVLAPYLLEEVGINIPRQSITVRSDPPAVAPAPPEDPPVAEPSGDRAIPERDAAVVAAAEVAVLRALELANKRRVTRAQRARVAKLRAWDWQEVLPAPAEQDWARLLDGAFAEIAEVIPGQAPCVASTLADYVRGLIRAGHTHQSQRAHLITGLRRAGCI